MSNRYLTIKSNGKSFLILDSYKESYFLVKDNISLPFYESRNITEVPKFIDLTSSWTKSYPYLLKVSTSEFLQFRFLSIMYIESHFKLNE